MNTQSIIGKSLRSLSIGPVLSVIPLLVLVFTLLKSGHWKDALNALQGEYTIGGVPSNPWGGFLSVFLPGLLTFVALSWLSTLVARSTQPDSLKFIVGFLLVSLASLAFGVSMACASISSLWFQDALVIGSAGSPTLFWLSVLVSLVVLSVNFCKLAMANSVPP